MNLILVRHGETTGGSSVRYWGATDVPLSEKGLEQAASLRKKLAGDDLRAAYCSELCRAVRTAEEITRGRGLNVNLCAGLNEVNFGKVEGYTADEIKAAYPEFYRDWAKWDPHMTFPGGESVSEFQARVSGFIKLLRKNDAEGNVLVVAHAGSLRMLICSLLELPLSYWRKLKLDLASVSRLEVTECRTVLTCLNDTCHLEK